MNNQCEYAEKSLTPKIAQHLIHELFTGKTVQKQEIMRIVDETHRERGGLAAKAKFPPVTMALPKMKREELVENPSHGYWLILATTPEDDSVDSEPDNLDIEKTIGSGKQSVYLYYYPAYRHLAELQGEEVWACKIGKARNDPLVRISSQTRTVLPEYPMVGLIIKTDEFTLMETTIQNILKLQGKHIENAPGTEWFLTSPSEVEGVYESNFGNFK